MIALTRTPSIAFANWNEGDAAIPFIASEEEGASRARAQEPVQETRSSLGSAPLGSASQFGQNATWTFNNSVTDRIRQLDTAGGANLWVQNLQLRSAAVPNGFTDGRMGADLLGKPVYEATAQSGTFTTG